MVGVDICYKDKIRQLGLRQIGLIRNRVNNDNLPGLLKLNAGVSERGDHDLAAGGRNASGRGYLGLKQRRCHRRRHDDQRQSEGHMSCSKPNGESVACSHGHRHQAQTHP